MILRFAANSEKCRKYMFLGGSAQIITILHRGGLSKFITILHGGGGLLNLLQYYKGGAGASRDPKFVLRNIWTAPQCWHESRRRWGSWKDGEMKQNVLGRCPKGKVSIPDICHFFYTHKFWGLKILHSKVRKFMTKVASQQNSVNHSVKIHILRNI